MSFENFGELLDYVIEIDFRPRDALPGCVVDLTLNTCISIEKKDFNAFGVGDLVLVQTKDHKEYTRVMHLVVNSGDDELQFVTKHMVQCLFSEFLFNNTTESMDWHVVISNDSRILYTIMVPLLELNSDQLLTFACSLALHTSKSLNVLQQNREVLMSLGFVPLSNNPVLWRNDVKSDDDFNLRDFYFRNIKHNKHLCSIAALQSIQDKLALEDWMIVDT